jgi:1-acyl-sn-glycerol-3-phosphate acyltransferase
MVPFFVILVLAAALAVWLGLVLGGRRLLVNPRGDVETGLAYHTVRAYVRLVHRVRYEGIENIPPALAGGLRTGDGPGSAGPLIVVSNHTAGIDPLLIQSACLFEIRWMMGRDMLAPVLGWLWEWAHVIPVSRAWVEQPGTAEPAASRADSRSALEAIRHLRAGAVLGVFPEGRIEQEPGHLLPFLPGVGVLAKKTGAAVLPVVIRGTPAGGSAWGSLFRPSHATVRFLPILDSATTHLDAAGIIDELRQRMETVMKWHGHPAQVVR